MQTRAASGTWRHGEGGGRRHTHAAALEITRQPLPPRRLWGPLAVVGLGVVGFPPFSAWALERVPAAHGAVIVRLLPTAPAVMAALCGGEQPLGFWLASLLGFGAVLAFAAVQGAGKPLILVAVLLCALGYTEGGRLARELGGWQVISWALVLSAPVLAPVVARRLLRHGATAGGAAWLAFAYVSLVSMYFAFFAWYRALARGGIARFGQVQLAQPVLMLLWSAAPLGERITWAMALAAAAVRASVALTQRMRVVHDRRA